MVAHYVILESFEYKCTWCWYYTKGFVILHLHLSTVCSVCVQEKLIQSSAAPAPHRGWKAGRAASTHHLQHQLCRLSGWKTGILSSTWKITQAVMHARSA